MSDQPFGRFRPMLTSEQQDARNRQWGLHLKKILGADGLLKYKPNIAAAAGRSNYSA